MGCCFANLNKDSLPSPRFPAMSGKGLVVVVTCPIVAVVYMSHPSVALLPPTIPSLQAGTICQKEKNGTYHRVSCASVVFSCPTSCPKDGTSACGPLFIIHHSCASPLERQEKSSRNKTR
ncbi:hypothetical protein MUK42_28800, partial [Musa troglodytarum]